jgi:uncharacterized membrane-anchored protein
VAISSSITGSARCGRRTKALVNSLREGEIAVIFHRDLDTVAARDLAACRPAAVVNVETSMSGRYVNGGPRVLLEAGIPLYDADDGQWAGELKDGATLSIEDGQLLESGRQIARLIRVDEEYLRERGDKARENVEREMSAFARNTLRYLADERTLLFDPPEVPPLETRIANRPALIVVRNEGYREDLRIVTPYVQEQKPVLIGVDGGADAIREAGLRLDIALGDMDSISDDALKAAREIVVHAYTDGRAPGLERVNKLGLKAVTFATPGTSEDAAMLLAYERGASLIVAVGAHFSLEEFLDKGRAGMASTFLTRLRVGSRLVDAKGLSRLYRGGLRPRYILSLLAASAIPIAVVLLSPPFRYAMGVWAMKLQMLLWRMTH